MTIAESRIYEVIETQSYFHKMGQLFSGLLFEALSAAKKSCASSALQYE